MSIQPVSEPTIESPQIAGPDNISSLIGPPETDVCPPPTAFEIHVIRYTWERLTEIRHAEDDPCISSSHAFGLLFYEALFALEPNLQPLFSNVLQKARALTGILSYFTFAPSIAPPSSDTACIRDRRTLREINDDGRRASKWLQEANTSTTSSSPIITAATAVAALSPNDASDTDSQWLVDQLRQLGARHAEYLCEPQYFSLIGPALVIALQKRLRCEYVPEIGEAWLKANDFIAHHMAIGLETQLAWEKKTVEEENNATTCMIQ